METQNKVSHEPMKQDLMPSDERLLHLDWHFPYKDFLKIEGLSHIEIGKLLDIAEYYCGPVREKHKPTSASNKSQAHQRHSILNGLELINLFFENSTRTRTSFEAAAFRLGANVINIIAESSSIKKGESLLDTAFTLNAMSPDLLVVRHSEAGAVELLANKVDAAVINAGDGAHEHPTQALLDALTIRRKLGHLQDLTVAICGDITHSRVARSNIHLLSAMGANVRLIAPPTLMPTGIEDLGATLYHSMEEGLKDCDIIMMLRLQLERMKGAYVPSIREYFEFFGLNRAKLDKACPNALIMHPGPINRGVEIDSDLADDIDRSLITDQVAMGVSVRMGLLDLLTRPKKAII